MNCSRCGNALSPSMKFCRSCGAAVEETEIDRNVVPASPDPAAPPQRTAPTSPQGSDGGKGPMFALGAVAICLVLAGLVGGGAYLLTRDGSNESETLYEPVAPWEESAVEPAEVEATTSGESSSEPIPSDFEEARGTFRAHWQAIADGRYGEAYDLFHPGYEADRGGWIATHETEATLVNMYGITVEPGATEPREGEYWLYVEVPLRDGGGAYAGDCRLFYGEVRMARSAGELLYRPGVYEGREGSFGRSELGGGVRDLPESSPRCP